MANFFKRLITALCLCAGLIILYLLPTVYSSFIIGALLIIIMTTEWPRIAQANKSLWLLAYLYPTVPFLILIILNQSELYRPLLALVILSASAHDTGSYIVGNLIGSHLIAPTISPGKTWEGLLGGIITTLLVIILVVLYFQLHVDILLLVVFAIMTSVIAFFGDLFESWLKRKAGIKDSGTLLPGHGGLLDRLDSILFVAVFFYAIRHLIYVCV